MIHPDTELRFVNEAIGYGVFATRPIPRGTITWARDMLDQVFEPERFAKLPGRFKRILERYAYVDKRGRWVLCWDLARSVNHCCEASCLSPGYEFEIAIRDVAAGEQLTDEYGTLNLHEPFECRCGAPGCRGTVRPDDVVRLHEVWDGAIRSSFPLIREVPQPLWELVSKRDRDEVEQVLADPSRLRSSLSHFYDLAARKKAKKKAAPRSRSSR